MAYMYKRGMSEKGRAEPPSNIENRLRSLRLARGYSQGELAGKAGITRQAVYAIESKLYLPTTAVALRLAGALGCRVEDIFALVSSGEVIEGELIGVPQLRPRTRVKVAHVGGRTIVRPVAQLGDVLTFTVPADGLALTTSAARRGSRPRVRVELLRDRRLIQEAIVVAGCDPAIYLAGEYLRSKDRRGSIIEWPMGSVAALDALKRGEVHLAGVHILDARSGESNLPYLRRHVKHEAFTVVTFAAWEAGLLVPRGNPKGIREIADLARSDVNMVNREEGAGARVLLDQRLTALGIPPGTIKGYGECADSHLDVAKRVALGQVDVGVGVRSAATLLGLEFIPIQEERYDLVMPRDLMATHPGLANFLDTIVTRAFRAEIEALGGYDTRDTGKVHELHRQRRLN